MSRVVALAGLGEDASPPQLSARTMLLWGIVMGMAAGIFLGTLMLNPSKKRS